MSLQEKYCALKDGTLKELEAKLKVLTLPALQSPPSSEPLLLSIRPKNSKEHMDKFKCAAMRLASHWKEEAERQALMVQSACGAEMEDELRRLKVQPTRHQSSPSCSSSSPPLRELPAAAALLKIKGHWLIS